MFYKPELIVYVWLLPVTCFVVLPAFFSTCRVTMGAMCRSKVDEKNYKIPEQEQSLENRVLA